MTGQFSHPDRGSSGTGLGDTVAVDIGQTGFRARTYRGKAVVAETSGGGYRSAIALDTQLAQIVRSVAEVSKTRRFDAVAIGMTGLRGIVPGIDSTAARLREEFGISRLVVADDAVTAYLGAMGNRAGVVVAVGTGLVALGHGHHGESARVDGAGAMVGDEGAGWWIGRQGLIAALSVVDGREGASIPLLDAAQRRYGPAEQIPSIIAAADSPIAAVAAFAHDVAIAARGSDAVARRIWATAAGFIARAVVAAARRVGLTEGTDYALLGGVADGIDLLEPHLTVALTARLGRMRRSTPRGNGLDGASVLLDLPDTDSFAGLVRRVIVTQEQPQ